MKLPPLAEFESREQYNDWMKSQGWFDMGAIWVRYECAEPKPRIGLLVAATVCLVIAFAALWAFVEFNR